MLEQYLKFTEAMLAAHSLFFIEISFAIIIIFIGRFFFKKQQPAQPVTSNDIPIKKSPIIITSQDIKAIAGDDVITTQLDLARAYIEIGKKKLATKILNHVIQHGNANQQQAAHHLMANL